MALDECLQNLQQINYAQYEQELQEIQTISGLLKDGSTDVQQVFAHFTVMGIPLQFHSFDEFDKKMQEADFVLEI